MENEEKRKPGRPRVDNLVEYRSISIKKSLWLELNKQAMSTGTTIGKVATLRIEDGEFRPELLTKRKETVRRPETPEWIAPEVEETDF